MAGSNKSTTKQVKTLKNGNPINVSAQFGQPNGNPRHNGAWKKEDTARYKLEKMITMSNAELTSITEDPEAPEFEKATADIILSIRVDTDKDGNKIPAHQRLKAIEGLINQVYGQPVQKEITKESDSNDEAFIKGYLLT
jgi:hypothetical protein